MSVEQDLVVGKLVLVIGTSDWNVKRRGKLDVLLDDNLEHARSNQDRK